MRNRKNCCKIDLKEKMFKKEKDEDEETKMNWVKIVTLKYSPIKKNPN
jgi:hypothetical protein